MDYYFFKKKIKKIIQTVNWNKNGRKILIVNSLFSWENKFFGIEKFTVKKTIKRPGALFISKCLHLLSPMSPSKLDAAGGKPSLKKSLSKLIRRKEGYDDLCDIWRI